jgi:hypothetical protein
MRFASDATMVPELGAGRLMRLGSRLLLYPQGGSRRKCLCNRRYLSLVVAGIAEVSSAGEIVKRSYTVAEFLESPHAGAVEERRISIRSAIGTDSIDLQKRLAHQMNAALFLPPNLTKEEMRSRMAAGLALLEEINPRDGLEGMLAVQMVATHNTALECFKRAVHGEQTPEALEVCLRHGQKLMAAFLQQLEVLDKRRGRGPQTVMVQSLNVEAGGQAVVGTVNTGPRDQPGADAGSRADTVAPQASKAGAAHETSALLGWEEA